MFSTVLSRGFFLVIFQTKIFYAFIFGFQAQDHILLHYNIKILFHSVNKTSGDKVAIGYYTV
jgi:hypothetical protein